MAYQTNENIEKSLKISYDYLSPWVGDITGLYMAHFLQLGVILELYNLGKLPPMKK
jgi:hypothetical protein